MVKSAVAGGAGSALGGGKFADGAVTAAFTSLFNDAVVLNADIGDVGLADHQAILIGDDRSGWYYYTKDGYGRGTYTARFDTLDEALRSSEIAGRYDRAWRTETSDLQDFMMIVEGFDEADTPYAVLGNNCGDLVKACLDAGEVDFPDTVNPRSTQEFMENSDEWTDISDQLH